MKKTVLLVLAAAVLSGVSGQGQEYRDRFREALRLPWEEVFFDSGTGNWQERWFKDGDRASVENTPEGMLLKAGPVANDDANHLVLWTLRSFAGDVKIEYDFTRIDANDSVRAVNIVYIGATGSGAEGYGADISTWNDLRRRPAMRLYYNHMNAYHISYAVVEPDSEEYVRARRYMPGAGLRGSELPQEYFRTGLFRTGVKYHITIVKKERELWMNVRNEDTDRMFYFDGGGFPPVGAGRIGLRLMSTRQSLIGNFSVCELTENQDVLTYK